MSLAGGSSQRAGNVWRFRIDMVLAGEQADASRIVFPRATLRHSRGSAVMSRVMMLVSEQGTTIAETRVDGEGAEADAIAEAQLREEARTLGFDDDEVAGARLVWAGDPPNQP